GTATVRVPLRQLLLEERGSSSSSPGKRADEEEEDDDELDGVPAETYCLWSPGTSPSPSPSPSRCQKSGSTGSVLRWRQRLQVGRSHSDGKEKFVFLQAQQDPRAQGVDVPPVQAGPPRALRQRRRLPPELPPLLTNQPTSAVSVDPSSRRSGGCPAFFFFFLSFRL
uniref:Uncharacterized protein n=1 Tax=Aegilops tauschii subsp. strangulata TaxID=200361 RepID=A0A452ZYF2_AEGTS